MDTKIDISTCSPEYWIQNKENCENYLKCENVWKTVPSVNFREVQDLKDNCLVRFRGMIQDMYNPEYYFEKCEVLNDQNNEKYMKNGKYTDSTNLTEHETIIFKSKHNVTCERQTLVVISLPGLNPWVRSIEKESNQTTKQIERTDMSINKSSKRPMDDNEMETEEMTRIKIEKKKQCTENEQLHLTTVSREHILNFPLMEESGKCCHVKIYENADTLKLNEMVDFIGFLSLDPVLTDPSYHNNEEDNQMEIQTHNPPPSLVPRIHCVAFKKFENCNPLLGTIPLSLGEITNLRKELLIVLTQLLLGDELAAEYVICHLISCVYLRKDLMAIGKFSVNISNIPALQLPNYGEELYNILKMLVPKSHYLPMTLDNMNLINFIPKKDYECNRLTSGLLQLSCNTHLVLDETRLQPGKLNDSACRGLAAISNTIKNQKVTYDFNYYQMEYESDIPFLVISEGKSLLPSDVHIILVPDSLCLESFPEIKEAAVHFLKPELLNKLRIFLSMVRHSTYELSEDCMEMIQNEFVKMRQDGNVTGDDLHQLLVLARLICLSSGKSSLDGECWRKACDMEIKRKGRITNRTNKN